MGAPPSLHKCFLCGQHIVLFFFKHAYTQKTQQEAAEEQRIKSWLSYLWAMCPLAILSSLQTMMTPACIFKVEVLAISVKVLYVQKEVWTDRCVCPWWILRRGVCTSESLSGYQEGKRILPHRKNLFRKHVKRLAGFHSLGVVQFSDPNFLAQGRWRWSNDTKEGWWTDPPLPQLCLGEAGVSTRCVCVCVVMPVCLVLWWGAPYSFGLIYLDHWGHPESLNDTWGTLARCL